jgi:hypothetical protein
MIGLLLKNTMMIPNRALFATEMTINDFWKIFSVLKGTNKN